MARVPIQVAVFPFRRTADGFRYGVFRRSDASYWQPIAGGATGEEDPLQAARREALEEAGIPLSARYSVLKTRTCVRADNFKDCSTWPANLYVVPLFYFAVEYEGPIVLSHEHAESRWVTCEQAIGLLRWDADKTAVWELEQRLRRRDLQEPGPLQHASPGQALHPAGDWLSRFTATRLSAALAAILGTIWILDRVLSTNLAKRVFGRPVDGAAWAVLLLAGGIAFACSLFWLGRYSNNPRDLPEDDPRCPDCGYVLYGASDRRCPDCGRPFVPEEVDLRRAVFDRCGVLWPKKRHEA